MARKDFEQYYSKIKAQYLEMTQDIQDMSQLALTKAIDPDVLEQMQKTLAPIKESYMTMSYVEYLLNLPVNKQVRTRNARQFEKQLSKIDDKNQEKAVLDKNQRQLEELRELTR